MKKIFILFILIIAGFIFFSFLLRTSLRNSSELFLYYEKSLVKQDPLIVQTISFFHQKGKKVHIGTFEPSEIDNYILSNPHSIFIVSDHLTSKLFTLQSITYTTVPIVVTNRLNKTTSIPLGEFKEIQQHYSTDMSLHTALTSPSGLAVVPLQKLTLNVKPLSVDGVFPSIKNIRNGTYPLIKTGIIYSPERKLIKQCTPFITGKYQLKKMFSIIAGGDIILSRGIRPYIEKYGPEYPFLSIQAEIKAYDIAFANLETPITQKGNKFTPFKGIYFKTNPMVVKGLQSSGFDILSLANNHILDWGSEGAKQTMYFLRKNKIAFSGVGRNKKEALCPAVFHIKGMTIAFISINDVYPFTVTDKNGTMQTYSLHDGKIKSDMSTLKEKYDIIVVSVHAGKEYIQYPKRKKIIQMRELIDYGAQVVLGSHPHVIQAIEIYHGGLIAYSLGNLIFDQNWSEETTEGLLLEIGFVNGKPVYYYPILVSIANGCVKIAHVSKNETIISHLLTGRINYEYAKN